MPETEEVQRLHEAEVSRLMDEYYLAPLGLRPKQFQYMGLLSHNVSVRYQESLTEEFSLETEEIYWKKHNEDYLYRLDFLEASLSETEIFQLRTANEIVIIPVRNETNLVPVMKAIKKGIKQKGKEISLQVLIYHNYTEDEIPKEVHKALIEVQQKYGVIIINEQVSNQSKIQDSKKVSLDLALWFKQPGKNIPIIMLDADIASMSYGSIVHAISLLEESNNPIALASSEYTYTTKFRRKYPALYHYIAAYQRLGAKTFIKYEDSINTDIIKGGFLIGKSNAFLLLGGLLPYHYYLEDVALTQQLKMASKIRDSDSPLYMLNDYNRIVEVNPTREVSSILSGTTASPFQRWRHTINYDGFAYSGKKRLSMQQIHRIAQNGAIPLLLSHKHTSERQLSSLVLKELLVREMDIMEEVIPLSEVDFRKGLFTEAFILYYFQTNQQPSAKMITYAIYDTYLELDLDPSFIKAVVGNLLGELQSHFKEVLHDKVLKMRPHLEHLIPPEKDL